MKRPVSLLLIIGFVGIAIFSFALFDHGMDSSNSDCVASAVDGTVCPTSIMGMTLHHISVLQALTRTVMPPISHWLLALFSLLLVSVSTFIFYKNLLYPKLKFLRWRLRDLVLDSFYRQQKIISWLSLFELSPAV